MSVTHKCQWKRVEPIQLRFKEIEDGFIKTGWFTFERKRKLFLQEKWQLWHADEVIKEVWRDVPVEYIIDYGY